MTRRRDFLPKSINGADANTTKSSRVPSKEKMRSDIEKHETDNGDKQNIDLSSFEEDEGRIAKLEKEHAADVNDILRKHETEKLGYVTKLIPCCSKLMIWVKRCLREKTNFLISEGKP